MLGKEEFKERLLRYAKRNEGIKEILGNQRYIYRPDLSALLEKDTIKNREKRKKKIKEAVMEYGYSQKEVADYLNVHYSAISRLVNG